mgnify:FL=1
MHTAVRSEVPAVAGALSSGMITSPVTRAPIRARFVTSGTTSLTGYRRVSSEGPGQCLPSGEGHLEAVGGCTHGERGRLIGAALRSWREEIVWAHGNFHGPSTVVEEAKVSNQSMALQGTLGTRLLH